MFCYEYDNIIMLGTSVSVRGDSLSRRFRVTVVDERFVATAACAPAHGISTQLGQETDRLCAGNSTGFVRGTQSA